MPWLHWGKKNKNKKQRQELLQNDDLQLNENAVIAKNIYEQGCPESPELVKVEKHCKYHHTIKALQVILSFTMKVKNKVLGLIILHQRSSV